MITLCWRRNHTSALDQRRLANAIGPVIPMLVQWHKATAAISKNIKEAISSFSSNLGMETLKVCQKEAG